MKKDINLLLLQSDLVGHNNMKIIHSKMIKQLEKNFNVHYYSEKEIEDAQSDDHLTMIWIGSGGTEERFRDIYPQWKKPIILLNDGISNSLAASLEIASWLKRKEVKFKTIHDTPEHIALEVKALQKIHEARENLRGQRIGVIGKPSNWLIASDVNPDLARKKWGIEFIEIDLNEVLGQYDKILSDPDRLKDAENLGAKFRKTASAQIEGNAKEITKAVCLYFALNEVVKLHKLQAFTLRCFGLIDHCKTTGCLALALLNRDGILAGCEGDMQSILTLVIAKALTGQTGFMANPSLIFKETNQMVLAHCMIDPSLTSSYVIRSHYETQSGIAIQGLLPLGRVTVAKIGGKNLDESFISGAQLEENPEYSNFCRTQIRLTLDKPVSYFLENPIGNHHIILLGDHSRILQEMLED